MGSPYIAQAGLTLISSSYPLFSASQTAGTEGISHHARLQIISVLMFDTSCENFHWVWVLTEATGFFFLLTWKIHVEISHSSRALHLRIRLYSQGRNRKSSIRPLTS
jgi:hypothetical protein